MVQDILKFCEKICGVIPVQVPDREDAKRNADKETKADRRGEPEKNTKSEKPYTCFIRHYQRKTVSQQYKQTVHPQSQKQQTHQTVQTGIH